MSLRNVERAKYFVNNLFFCAESTLGCDVELGVVDVAACSAHSVVMDLARPLKLH